jgi:exonuclease III
MSDTLHLLSLNVQGLRDKAKRHRFYMWLQQQKGDIICIQETHFDTKIEKQVLSEWEGDIYYAHGESNSKGVAILVRNTKHCEVINTHSGKDGRTLLVNIQVHDHIYTLVNVYAPNEETNRKTFFKTLGKCIDQHGIGSPIICGDFNEVIDARVDRISSRKNTSAKPQKVLHSLRTLIKSRKLKDIWRDLNPEIRQFTWRRKATGDASRIDYWLLSNSLMSNVISCDIRPAQIKHTDHQAVSLKIREASQNKGRGYWKINNSILSDTHYKNKLSHVIHDTAKEAEEDNLNKQHTWDLIKIAIRDHTVLHCKQQAKNTSNELSALENKLKHLRQKTDFTDENTAQEIEDVEEQIGKIYEYKSRGAQIRARAEWLENGEKNNKYFLGLGK